MSLEQLIEAGPHNLDWKFGALPPVETVPWDQLIVLWTYDYIGFVTPGGDEQNYLRWHDHGNFPAWGVANPSGWWTILHQGSLPRPEKVKTFFEMYPEETP